MKTKTGKTTGKAAVALALIVLAGWIMPDNYYQLSIENDFLRMLKKKADVFNERLPEDRLYLHFDKPFYEPGETMWFSAYVRNGSDLKPSEQSDIVHVELIGPKGNTEKTINLIAKN